MTFGDRLRALRHGRDLTLDRVAHHTRLGLVNIHRMETGKSGPSVATLARLADFYGVTMDYLWLGREAALAAS